MLGHAGLSLIYQYQFTKHVKQYHQISSRKKKKEKKETYLNAKIANTSVIIKVAYYTYHRPTYLLLAAKKKTQLKTRAIQKSPSLEKRNKV